VVVAFLAKDTQKIKAEVRKGIFILTESQNGEFICIFLTLD
jgi:hypothetical protein